MTRSKNPVQIGELPELGINCKIMYFLFFYIFAYIKNEGVILSQF